MSASAGQIALDLVLNEKKFQSQLKGIVNLAKNVGAALAGAFAVKGIADFTSQCMELGSDLAEVQNVVDVAFPNMNSKINEFAQNAAAQFGLSETMAKRYSGTLGAMAQAFGFNEKAAADMSTALTGLAGDVASFYNISQDEAFTKLKAVFTGETESLKDLGVVMTQTALDQYAMANGFGKTTAAMTEQEKVALRYQFVQEQLSKASGDFYRTSDGWANQMRVLNLQMDSIKATLGQGFINLFTPIIKQVNTLLGKLSTLASAFKSFTELVTGKKSDDSEIKDVSTSADSASESVEGIGDAAKKTQKILLGFDKIKKVSSDDSSGTSAGGSGSNGGESVNYGKVAEGETVVDKFGSKFTTLFNNIQTMVQPTVDSLKKLYSEGLLKLGSFTGTALKDFYTNFLVPVGKWTLGEGLPKFVDTINNGLNNINFSKINKSLNKLWAALTPFAINVGEGLLWFWDNVLVPLGTWVANEVVPRFLDTLSSSIDALNSIIEALKPLFGWFWDNVLTPIASWTAGKFLDIWDGINTAIESFGSWCEKNPGTIQTATVAIGAFFAAWKGTQLAEWVINAGGVIAILGKLKTAIAAATLAKIKDKAETLKIIALYAKDTAAKIANKVATIASTVAQKAMTVAQKALNLVMNANPFILVVTAIGLLVTAFVTLYAKCEWFRNGVNAIWSAVKQAFITAFEAIKTFATVTLPNAFKTAVTKIKNAFSGIKTFFTNKYTQIKNVFTNVATWFSTKFSAAYNKVTGAFNNVKTFFTDTVWGGIKSSFSGIAKWFKDTFSKAWSAVKNVFSTGGKIFDGIKDGIASTFKTIVNGLISGINKIIKVPFEKINGMLNTIRAVEVLGVKPFKGLWEKNPLEIPQIPKLAQGGFVKKNSPQLAMIGDNRHYGEIVAPEDKLQEMVDKAVALSGNGVSKDELERIINNAVMRMIAALSSVGFNVDGETLARLEKAKGAALDRRYNNVTIA